MAETRTILTVQKPYRTSDGTLLYLGTSTVVQVDSNGKYIPGSAEISLRQYTGTGFLATDFKTVAIRKAGEPWRLTQDGNQNTVAGIDLQRTLANRNSLLNIGLNNDVSNVLSAPLQGVPAGQANTNNQQSSNAAIGGPQVADAPTPDAPTSTPFDSNFTIKGKDQIDFKNWRYPIGKSDQDVIKFTMREYKPPSGLIKKEGRTGQTGNRLGTVVLPIQPTIIDNNSVNWQQDNINPLEVAGLQLYSGAVSGGVEGAREAIDDIIKNLGAEQENARKGFLGYLAGQAIGKNVLARVSGAILNPNIELLFNGPELRTFNYRFQLSAREKAETEQIRGIIGWFKAGMAVRRTPSELFLVTPNVFDIQYIYKPNIDANIDDIGKIEKNHPYLNRIKTCALTSCSVDYTPTGSYMTFGDGSMVSYTINLIFQELEPIYQDDYKAVGTEIGY
jgi:hypothetical protein